VLNHPLIDELRRILAHVLFLQRQARIGT
jgi:hypothetical protein